MVRSDDVYIPSDDGRLWQGEILSDMIELRPFFSGASLPYDVDEVRHAYAIVVSQDCDLEWDHRQHNSRTKLNILFCGAETASEARPRAPSNQIWTRIRQNNDGRFQFLEATPEVQDAQGKGLPELTVDFRKLFSLPSDEAYRQQAEGDARRRCRLAAPYLQHFVCRFYQFHQRVALPAPHFSEPVQP